MLFVDLDGVLADFSRHVKDHIGVYPHEDEALMQAEIPKIKDFWDTIPPMHDMGLLWEYVRRFNPRIITATANWDRQASEEAKPKWIAKHLPEVHSSRIHVVRRSEKANFAVRGRESEPCVLIDDFIINTTEWSRAGGVPILHISAQITINQLKHHSIQKLFYPVCA